MITIEQGSCAARAAGSNATEISAADSVVVGLILDNDAEESSVKVSFWLSDGKQHADDVRVDGQSSQPVSWEVGVLPEGGYTCAVQVEDAFGQVLSDGEATFHVGAGQSTAGYAGHDPQNYRLEVGEIAMRTEGGNIVHEEDEAFATERVDYYAEVVNSSDQWLGPVEVHFLVDGAPVGHGGMTHPGVGPGDTFWANGHTDPFAVGAHTLSIKIESSDPHLFVGSQRDVALTVLRPRSQGSVTEGNEDDIPGWTRRDLNLFIKDFEGRGVNGQIYVEINDGKHRTAERGVVEDGAVNISGPVDAPTNEGSLILTVDTASGHRLSGGGTFDDGENAITKTYVQGKRVETMTFENQQMWEAMVGSTVSGGFELKVFSGGIEVTGEYSWGETITQGREYEIWIAQDTLEDEERESARQR